MAVSAVETHMRRSVPLSHPEKKYFPSGFTKADMIRYYVEIAPFMLSHLKDRPVTAAFDDEARLVTMETAGLTVDG